MGPLVKPGRVAAEAGATAARVSSSSQRRDEGAPGDVVAQLADRLRLATALTPSVELGVEAEHMPIALSKRVASDAAYDELDQSHAWRFGPQLRLRQRDGARLGLGVEVAGGALPYAQTDVSWSTRTDYTSDPPTFWAWGPVVGESRSRDVFYVSARLAADAGLLLAADMELRAGVTIENLPVYDHSEWEEHCSETLGGWECSGRPEGGVTELAWLLVPYVEWAYRIDRFALLTQAFVVVGDQRLASHVPFGGQLALRLEVDLPRAEASSDDYRRALP